MSGVMGMGSLLIMLRELEAAKEVPSLRIPELGASLSLPDELACSRRGENLLTVITFAGWLYATGLLCHHHARGGGGNGHLQYILNVPGTFLLYKNLVRYGTVRYCRIIMGLGRAGTVQERTWYDTKVFESGLGWAGTGWDYLGQYGPVRESLGQRKRGSSCTQCSRHLLG